MQIKSCFYEWNANILDTKVKLGDSKETLLASNLIKEILNKKTEEISYTGINETPYRVVFKDDKVAQIWYKNNINTFKIDTIDLFEEFIPYALPILDKYFKNISAEITKLDDVKHYSKSDILWLNSGDSIIRFIAIIKSPQM